MKIGFIGDLHMDYNVHHDFVSCFRAVCEDCHLDAIVFCGDTTTGALYSLEFYNELSQKTGTQILEIPGNHELYCAPGKNKLKKNADLCFDVEEYLELMLNHPTYSLFTKPIVNKSWVVIGSPSWYDYSLHSKHFKMDRQKKERFLRRNPEYKYIYDNDNNPRINEELTQKSLALLERQLQTIRNRPNGDSYKICSCIHMLPIPELYKNNPIFNTTVAFMGSKYYAELYEKYKVDLCICAHSHNRMEYRKNGIHYVNVSLGHNFKWHHKTSLYKEVLDTMYILEI